MLKLLSKAVRDSPDESDEAGWFTCIAVVTMTFLFIAIDFPGERLAVAADLKIISGKDDVRWSRRLAIDNADSGNVQAAVFSGDSYYLAGKKWSKESNQQRLWVWKVDSQGQKVWERELDAKQSPEVIELLPAAVRSTEDQTPTGVRLVYSSALGTKTLISHVSADGEFSGPVEFPWPDETSGVIELADGELLLFGATMLDIRKTMQGWVARTSPSGEVRWKREFTPDDSLASNNNLDEDSLTPEKGYFQRTVIDRGIELADQSIVLVGQSGNYSKFGVGKSMLWILRIAPNGQNLSEASVDDAYSARMIRQPIVADATGFTIRHWKYTVNNEAPDFQASNQAGAAFWPWLSRFDSRFKIVDQGDMRTHLPPGVVTVGDWRPSLFPLSIGKSVLIRWSGTEGEEKQKVEIDSPGQIAPLMTVTGGDGILSVNNYRDTGATNTENRPQVLLVLLKSPK